MKFNKYFFDQDYSLRGILSWGTVGFWIGFLLTILFQKSLPFWAVKAILLLVGVAIFLLGVYLVKTKKTPQLDERLVLVQAKAYAYSWTVGVVFLLLGGIAHQENYIQLSVSDFSLIIIFIMTFVYFCTYYLFKNKA